MSKLLSRKLCFILLSCFFCFATFRVQAEEVLVTDYVSSDLPSQCWNMGTVSARNYDRVLLDLDQCGVSTGDIDNDGIHDLVAIGLMSTLPNKTSLYRNTTSVYYSFSESDNFLKNYSTCDDFYDTTGRRRDNFVSIYNDCWDERGNSKEICSFTPLVGGVMTGTVGSYQRGDIEMTEVLQREGMKCPIPKGPIDLFQKQGTNEKIKLGDTDYILGTKMIDRDGDGIRNESLIGIRGTNKIYGARIQEDATSISADIPTFNYIGSQDGDKRLISVNAFNYGDFYGDGKKTLVAISRENDDGKTTNKVNISSGGTSSYELAGIKYVYPEQKEGELLVFSGNELLDWGCDYGEYLDMRQSNDSYCRQVDPRYNRETITDFTVQRDISYHVVAKSDIKYEVMQSAVAVGDIDGDGKDDVLVVGGAAKVKRLVYPKAFNIKDFDCRIGNGCRRPSSTRTLCDDKDIYAQGQNKCLSFSGDVNTYMAQLEKSRVIPQYLPWITKGIAKVYLNKTDESTRDLVFDEKPELFVDNYIRDAVILDYNHDGLGDLLTLSVDERNKDRGWLNIFISKGHGYFREPIKRNIGQDLRTFLIDNLDGKGGEDLVFLNGTGLIEVWLNSCDIDSDSNPLFKDGNANGDKYIDLVDFEIWREVSLDGNNSITKADFNGSGNVDNFDFIIWKNSYFKSLDNLLKK
jgi:hypothetical protein